MSWNVNGIRAIAKKGFATFLSRYSPDVIGLQEIKISHEVRLKTEFDFSGYTEYWNSAKRPGYSGTAILVREGLEKSVKSYQAGVGIPEFDDEGRAQTIDLGKAYFLNVYFPNANHELSRLAYKMEFNRHLLKYIKKLEEKKPVILGGDYNVAHQEIDLARPKENVGNPGFTDEERASMDEYIGHGLVDSFRLINGNQIKYSWWSFRAGARQRNIGWRIDYLCVSNKLAKKIKGADILGQIQGSDHAPVVLEIEI
jgi:exodeoxyribonuclease-3